MSRLHVSRKREPKRYAVPVLILRLYVVESIWGRRKTMPEEFKTDDAMHLNSRVFRESMDVATAARELNTIPGIHQASEVA